MNTFHVIYNGSLLSKEKSKLCYGREARVQTVKLCFFSYIICGVSVNNWMPTYCVVMVGGRENLKCICSHAGWMSPGLPQRNSLYYLSTHARGYFVRLHTYIDDDMFGDGKKRLQKVNKCRS
jgi:hypothetical protein